MTLRTTLMAAFVTVGMIGAANADPVSGQISIGAYVDAIGAAGVGGAIGLDFVQGAAGSASPGVAGGITSYSAGIGSFAGLGCANSGGACGTIRDIANFATSAPINSFLTLNTGGSTTITFDLTTITSLTRTQDDTGGSLMLTAMGVIHFTGFDDTLGVFTLMAQGNQLTSFSANTLGAAAPEPASLAILVGSLAALGLVRRTKA